jgi:hypothetical protein
VVKAKKGKGREKGKGKAITNSAIPYTSDSFVSNGHSTNFTPPSFDPSFANPFITSAQSTAITLNIYIKFLSSLS